MGGSGLDPVQGQVDPERVVPRSQGVRRGGVRPIFAGTTRTTRNLGHEDFGWVGVLDANKRTHREGDTDLETLVPRTLTSRV